MSYAELYYSVSRKKYLLQNSGDSDKIWYIVIIIIIINFLKWPK